MSSIFREKSLERVSSPEQLDDYIRVITPSIWLVLVAVVILILGVLAWNTLGEGIDKNSSSNEETTSSISMTDS